MYVRKCERVFYVYLDRYFILGNPKSPIAAISVSIRHEAEQYFRIPENNGRHVITESGIVTVRQPCHKSRVFVSDVAQGTRRGPVVASYLALRMRTCISRHGERFSLRGSATRRVSRKSRISRLSRFHSTSSSRGNGVNIPTVLFWRANGERKQGKRKRSIGFREKLLDALVSKKEK